MNKTLLDLDRVPTLEEMIEMFKQNDWSTKKVYDKSKITPEMDDEIKYIKRLIKEKYDPLARKMGRKKTPTCYTADNPLIKLQESTTNVVAEYTEKLITEHEDVAERILQNYNLFTDPKIHQKVDDFLNNAVETMMKVTQFDKIAEIFEEHPDHRDFTTYDNNGEWIDFLEKWNDYDEKREILSFDTLSEGEVLEGTEKHDLEKELLVEAAGKFWNLLTTDEKLLMQYRQQGLIYEEIAEKMGYETHTAIVKQRKKIEDKFRKFLAEEYNFT